jgi:hypothetical protein
MAETYRRETGLARGGSGGVNHWTPEEERELKAHWALLKAALPGRTAGGILKRIRLLEFGE